MPMGQDPPQTGERCRTRHELAVGAPHVEASQRVGPVEIRTQADLRRGAPDIDEGDPLGSAALAIVADLGPAERAAAIVVDGQVGTHRISAQGLQGRSPCLWHDGRGRPRPERGAGFGETPQPRDRPRAEAVSASQMIRPADSGGWADAVRGDARRVRAKSEMPKRNQHAAKRMVGPAGLEPATRPL